MSSTADKINGRANEAVGDVKQGNVTDNDEMKAEGKAQELEGKAQKITGDVEDGAKHVADEVSGEA